MRTLIAIIISGASILWFLIFLQQAYIAIFIAIIAIIWFFIYLKKKQDKLEDYFQKRYSGQNIKCLDKSAIFRAQQSNGYSQTQGKGYLVLTDDELYFEMILFNIILSIPVASIIQVETSNRLLGVNPGRPMLKVEFKDCNGNNDAIALNVKELTLWVNAITEAIQGQS